MPFSFWRGECLCRATRHWKLLLVLAVRAINVLLLCLLAPEGDFVHFSIGSCLKAHTELSQTKCPRRSKHILLLTLPVHYKQKHTCISYHTYTIIIWYLTNHLEIEGTMRVCACQWEWGCCDICRHLCKVQFFFCRGPAGRLK